MASRDKPATEGGDPRRHGRAVGTTEVTCEVCGNRSSIMLPTKGAEASYLRLEDEVDPVEQAITWKCAFSETDELGNITTCGALNTLDAA